MKPKERFLNYALLSTTSCEPSSQQSHPFKEDIPIDLSCKRTSSLHPSITDHHHQVSLEHIIKAGPFSGLSDPNTIQYLAASAHPEWPLKYSCYQAPPPVPPTGAMAPTHHHPGTVGPNSALFPYLLLNPHHHLHQASGHLHHSSSPMIRSMQPEIEPLIHHNPFPYRISAEGHFKPLDAHHLALYNRHVEQRRLQQAEELASSGGGSARSPPSSASSPPHEPFRPEQSSNRPQHPNQHPQHQHTNNSLSRSKSIESSHTPSAFKAPSTKRSQSASPTTNRMSGMKKSNSYPNLPHLLSRPLPAARLLATRVPPITRVRRTKSEDCLHRIKIVVKRPSSPAIITSPIVKTEQIQAPKKMFTSNYQQKRMSESSEEKNDFEKENNAVQGSPKSRFHRHFRKEVIESWDNENKQITAGSNALDLRTSPPTFADKISPIDLQHHFNKLSSGDVHDVKQPLAIPMDIYRQYYYYLMQEPTFASRAAAVAMAETYAKILTSPTKITEEKAFSMVQTNVEQSPPYDSIRTSPDFVLTGSRAELRSADTTNGVLPFDRKRISRPLTGKHVRHGTGASPATLVGLRNMIQQRQKLREIGRLDQSNRFGKAKNAKRVKRK